MCRASVWRCACSLAPISPRLPPSSGVPALDAQLRSNAQLNEAERSSSYCWDYSRSTRTIRDGVSAPTCWSTQAVAS